MNWRSKSLFDGPAATDTADKCAIIQMERARPISQDFHFAIESEPDAFALILGLFTPGDPFAVRWAVSKVVIYPFNTEPRSRRRPHVRQEALEFEPPLADRDPASFVVAVHVAIWFVFIASQATADFHVEPRSICAAIPVSMAARLCALFFSEAATASGITISEAPLDDYCRLSTITFTKPPFVFCVTKWREIGRCFSDNGQSAKPMTRKVDMSCRLSARHACLLIGRVRLGVQALAKALGPRPLYTDPVA